VGPGYDAVPAGERWGAPLQLRGGGQEQQGGRTKELRACPAAPPPPGHSRSQVSVANSEPVFVNLLRSPGIDSQPGGPVR
jgi:hypothetical protein